jgi:hypothetical protein
MKIDNAGGNSHRFGAEQQVETVERFRGSKGAVR